MSTVTDELIESLKQRLPDQEDRLKLERLRNEIARLAPDRKPEFVQATPADDPAGRVSQAMAANWRWAFEARESGKLAPYAGMHVVIADGRVLVADRDANAAIEQAEKITSVPPCDLAVLYVDEPGAEGWFDVS